tara:strand:- start:5014 stop:5673 length:660 start_codon:yes stop_codon:yes gene_type:complete
LFPEFNDSIINSIDYFVVENIKVSAAFIKKTYPQKEINYDNFELLNENNPIETSKHLSPCIDGKNIGLLSDAGCPNIADPGSKLILHAHENNIKVIPLVGPSSIFLAMMGSGLNGNNFSFNGYLPIDENERSRKIKKLEIISLKNNQSQIFIETPYRNQKLLNEFLKYLNNNTYLCIAKNIGSNNEYIKTKKIHEWKKLKFTIDKEPTIFVFHSGEIIS